VWRASEVARIREHLAGAEAEMRARDVGHLGDTQRLVRAVLLEELAAYREAGVFPKNRDYRELTPYFVDADGVRCAMAHLVEIGGRPDLVAKIARERNNASIAELADEAELLAWLDAAGITVGEAARIQPSYCPTAPASRLCQGTPQTVVAATVLARNVPPNRWTAETRPGRLRVDAVYVGDGHGPGPAVGSEIEATVYWDAVIGAKAYYGLGDPRMTNGLWQPLPFAADGTVSLAMSEYGSSSAVTVGKEKAIEALTSKDCPAVLLAHDARWNGEPVDCDTPGPFGCSTHAVRVGCAADVTLVILVALLAARARRRAR
jgi:hypothetical protein